MTFKKLVSILLSLSMLFPIINTVTVGAEEALSGAKASFALKEITSDAPIQTFQQGEELKFKISAGSAATEDVTVTYEVLDFEENNVDSGSIEIKKGKSSAEFILESKKNGSYHIVANYNGQTIVQQFLVVTRLKDRKKVNDSPFGLDALMYGMRNDKNKALVEDYARLIELTGVTWTRDRVYFDNYVKKDGNNFTFSMPHTAVTGNLVNDKGINVIMAMNLQPEILRENDYGDVIPTNLFDVYYFWKQLAEEYDGAVNCWEIQNEIDLGGGGSDKDGADVYSSMFKAAALGIMDSDTITEVFVSPFGAASKPGHSSEHIELLFENDIYDYTSIANYHVHESVTAPYSSYYSYYGTYVPEGYIDLEDKHGYSLIEWNGESGISTDVPEDVDATAQQQMVQAKFLVTSFVEDLAAGTDKKFFFDGISRNEGAKSWGMMSRSKTNPAAYAAFGTLSAMTHVLGEGIYLGKLKDMPEGVIAYAFADGEDTAVVYYSGSTTGEKYDFNLNTGKNSVNYFDIFANKTELSSQNGSYSLTAEEYPQYIKFAGRLDENMFTDDKVDEYTTLGKTQKSVDDSKRVIILQKYDAKTRSAARKTGYNLTDESNGVDVEVFNFNDYPVSGVINGNSANGWEIEPAAQPIQIAPMSSATVHFEIIPDSAKGQQDRITFYGDMDCGRTSDSVIKAVGKKGNIINFGDDGIAWIEESEYDAYSNADDGVLSTRVGTNGTPQWLADSMSGGDAYWAWWSGATYSATYKVNAPETGIYKLWYRGSDPSNGYSDKTVIKVNGNKTDVTKVNRTDFTATIDPKGTRKNFACGWFVAEVVLRKGINEISYEVLEKSTSGQKYACLFDCMVLAPATYTWSKPTTTSRPSGSVSDPIPLPEIIEFDENGVAKFEESEHYTYTNSADGVLSTRVGKNGTPQSLADSMSGGDAYWAWWSGTTYSAAYMVNVPETGTYKLWYRGSDPSNGYSDTSVIKVNGKEATVSKVSGTDFTATIDPTGTKKNFACGWFMAEVNLEEGVNEISYEVLKKSTSGQKYSCLFDCMVLAPSKYEWKNPTIDTYPDISTEQEEYTSGDANGDKAVDVKDVMLVRRYVAGGYGVVLFEAAVDVNKDSFVDVKDVMLLRRYIAGGYGVELK